LSFGGRNEAQRQRAGFFPDYGINHHVFKDAVWVAFAADFDHFFERMELHHDLFEVWRIGSQENGLADGV